jgi:hypothetical protein
MTAIEVAKPAALPAEVMEALVQGDISKLSAQGRVEYYRLLCERLGLDPMTQPFGYLVLDGRLVLYANKACAEQLRKRDRISIKIMARENVNDCYTVTSQASKPDGRVDESIGAVAIGGLKGSILANAIMKAETKSKRRVTLSICGLGMIDESEIDTIEGARIIANTTAESEEFVPPGEDDAAQTIEAQAQEPSAPQANGAGATTAEQAAPQEEDPERARVIRHLFALIDEYARLGGQRGAALRAKMRNDDERHAFLLDNFGAHGLRAMPNDDLLRFISMIEQRINECGA